MEIRDYLLLLSITTCICAYWLYSPLPEDIELSSESKRSLLIVLGVMKIQKAVATAGDFLGFGAHEKIRKDIETALTSYFVGKNDDESVTEKNTVLDDIPVRIYEPKGRQETLPVVIYFHGGGCVYGNLDMFDNLLYMIVKHSGVVVLSVDFRFAPKHVFPAAFEDCLKVTKYVLKNAQDLNVDPNRVAVAGDSSGGNIAAAVSLKLRDEQFSPQPKQQLLLYPNLQNINLRLPSYIQNQNGPIGSLELAAHTFSLHLAGNLDCQSAIYANAHVMPELRKTLASTYLNVNNLPTRYLKDYVEDIPEAGNVDVWNKLKSSLESPYCSPLLAKSLKGLPEAYVFTSEFDILRDEGYLYVHRLRQEGVKVIHINSKESFHGIFSFTRDMPEARRHVMDLTKFIVDNL